jgi:rod shape-determining protein MreD
MRWLTFAICTVVVITLQAAIAPRLEWRDARPDWILVLVVFFALNGRSVDVLIGAWILGALVDLQTLPAPMGFYSLTYALVAVIVYSVREYLFREHILTYIAVTFVMCLTLQCVEGIHRLVALGADSGVFHILIRAPLTAAMLTALWGIPLFVVLLPFNRAMGLTPARPRRGRSWIGRRRRPRY